MYRRVAISNNQIDLFPKTQQINPFPKRQRYFSKEKILEERLDTIAKKSLAEKIKDRLNEREKCSRKALATALHDLSRNHDWIVAIRTWDKWLKDMKIAGLSYKLKVTDVEGGTLPLAVTMIGLVEGMEGKEMDFGTAKLLQHLSGDIFKQAKDENWDGLLFGEVGMVRTIATEVLMLTEMRTLAEKGNLHDLAKYYRRLEKSDSKAAIFLNEHKRLFWMVGVYLNISE